MGPQDSVPPENIPEQNITEGQNFVPSKKSLFKKLILPIFIGLFLIGVSFGYYFLFLANKTVPAEDTPQAQNQLIEKNLSVYVSYLSGTAWQIIDDRKVEIKEGDTLNQGAEIMTEENTRMVLVFDDGSIVRLDEDTLITLDEIMPEKIMISEENGNIFSRVQKDANHKFIVRASDVYVESLGTAFSVENRDEVEVKVFESKVKVKQAFGQEIEVEEKQKWDSTNKEKKELLSEDIKSDDFIDWSIEEEAEVKEKLAVVLEKPEKPKEEPKIVEEEKPTSSYSLKLSGKALDDGIFLSWAVSGIDVSKGFKIVKSQSSNPTFPGDGYVYVSDSSYRNYKLSLKDGKEWYIRVCRYKGDGTCDTYSNEVVVKAPYVKSEKSEGSNVDSISLKLIKKSDSKVRLEWNVEGKAEKGFKIVWSKNSGPTYPTRDGDKFHYLSDSGARSDAVSGLDSGKKYYFRVCEYLSGKCGTYSNEKSIEL